jgi:hypothetical protein
MHSDKKRIGRSEAKMWNTQRYEFDLVGVDLRWISGTPENSFRKIVGDRARDGWHLFPSFAPSTARRREAACLELLVDRPVV